MVSLWAKWENFSLGRWLNEWDSDDPDSPEGQYNREQERLDQTVYKGQITRPFDAGGRLKAMREQQDWRRRAHPFKSRIIDGVWAVKGLTENHLTPRMMYHDLLTAWQRSRRGWADYDTWNADQYWSRVIIEMLEKLREWRHGVPHHPDRQWDDEFGGAYTEEEWWDGIVPDIINCMRRAQLVSREPQIWLELNEEERAFVESEWRRGMGLLVEHWGSFWN